MVARDPHQPFLPDREKGKVPILECKGVTIEFGGLTAVDDFNITLGRTEIAGLIGPNGAGKTTVFNLLTKVYQPTRGQMFFDGVDTVKMNTIQANRAGIARTFQNIRLFKDMTVIENVLIGLHNNMSYHLPSALFRFPDFWSSEKKAKKKAMELLAILNLEGMADRCLFSGGGPQNLSK